MTNIIGNLYNRLKGKGPEKIKDSPKIKVRGKNFTASQRKLLLSNGLSENEVDKYLIQKTLIAGETGKRHLGKEEDKAEQWLLIHRDTGETRKVSIRRN